MWIADIMEAGPSFMRRLANKEMHIVRQGPDVLAMVWAPDGQEEKDIALKMAAAEDLLKACKAHEAVTEYSDGLAALSMDGTRITPQHMEKGRQLMERAKILREAAIAKAEGRS